MENAVVPKLNILILSTSPNSDATQQFKKSAIKRGHNPTVKHPSDLYLFVSDSESGYDRVYDGSGETAERIKANTIDAILPRIHSNVNYGIAIVRHFNQNLDIYSTQSASGIRAASNKWETHQKLSIEGVKTPKTIFAANPKHIRFLIDKVGGLPAISKTIRGSLGLGVMILKDEEQTNCTLETLYKAQVETLLQTYIDGNAKDIRAIVCGNEVIAAMERTAAKGEFRANVSRKGTGKKITLSAEDEQLCVNAAKAVNLEVCGVDLIKDPEGVSYILEVNAAFGMHVAEVTGIDVAGKIIEHIEKNYKRKSSPPAENNTSGASSNPLPITADKPLRKRIMNTLKPIQKEIPPAKETAARNRQQVYESFMAKQPSTDLLIEAGKLYADEHIPLSDFETEIIKLEKQIVTRERPGFTAKTRQEALDILMLSDAPMYLKTTAVDRLNATWLTDAQYIEEIRQQLNTRPWE